MPELTPVYVPALFILTTLGTIAFFYRATTRKSGWTLGILTGWTIFQSVLGYLEVYVDTSSIPPVLMRFGLFPTLIAIILLFITPSGRRFLDGLDLKMLTWLHSIRIPVEIVLALLFHYGLVSVYMTFHGTNFDILSGLTAIPVAIMAFGNKVVKRKLLIGWNVFALILLLNVVITAIFALPSPFQQLAFEQPNVAVLYFPYNLLPTVVVPLVLPAHLAALRQLLSREKLSH